MGNYKSAMYSLLPTGEAWANEREDTVLKKLIYGLASSLEDIEATTKKVVADYFPKTINTFTSDWEAILELPKCNNLTQDSVIRLSQISTMFNISPYSNKEFFENIANIFGYNITVLPRDPTDPFKIEIDIPEDFIYFKAGVSKAGDPLMIGKVKSELKCILEFFKQAHTYIVFV